MPNEQEGVDFRLFTDSFAQDARKIEAEYNLLTSELSRRTVDINVKFTAARSEMDKLIALSQGAYGRSSTIDARDMAVKMRSPEEQSARNALAQQIRDTRQLKTEADKAGAALEAQAAAWKRVGTASKDASAGGIGKGMAEAEASGSRLLARMFALQTASRAIAASLHLVNAIGQFNRADNLTDQVAAAEKLKEAIGQIPFIGRPAVALAEEISDWMNRGTTATKGQIEAQEKLNDATAKRLKILTDIRDEAIKVVDAQKVEEASIGKNPAEKRVIDLEEQLRQFDKRVEKAKADTGKTPEGADSERAARLRSIQNAQIEVDRQYEQESRKRNEKLNDEEADARIARIRSGGQQELAERLQLIETQKRKEREIQDRIDDASQNGRTRDVEDGKFELERQKAVDRQQLQAFDEQQRYELRKKAIDKMRQAEEEEARSESELRVAQLRAAGQDYEADRRAFEDAWDAKIKKIKETGDTAAVQRAEATRDAERAVRQQRRDEDAQSAQSRARVAELHANHQDRRAQLEELEERNKKLITDAEKSGDPRQIDAAYREARANLKRFQDDLKETPSYSQSSAMQMYSQLQAGVLNGQGGRWEGAQRDRQGAEIEARNEAERLRKAQDESIKKQGNAADKMASAADKILQGPEVLVLA